MTTAVKKEEKFILWFREIGKEDVALVGGKNSSLGEMYNNLEGLGVKVPPGFAITTHAYNHFIAHGGIEAAISEILKDLEENWDTVILENVSSRIRRLILKTPFPEDLRREIVAAYIRLDKEYGVERKSGSKLDVMVRSSALSEDKDDPFAGQLESFPNIRGEDEVLDAISHCFASNFTARVIDYRHEHGYDLIESMSVGVQKMARSDKGSAGMAFTLDTDTGFNDAIIINAGFGLGSPIVEGEINSDEYIVSKRMLKAGFYPVIGHTVVAKETKRIYAFVEDRTTQDVPVAKDEQLMPALTFDEILNVARCAVLIEEHYGNSRDIEFAKDGLDGELYIVQARPVKETEAMKRVREKKLEFDEYILDEKNPRKILSGSRVCDQIVTGKVRVITSVDRIHEFKDGEILVTKMTAPSWQPIMHKGKTLAIITDEGARKCHAGIIASNEGIPCIVGTGNATKVLCTGQIVTVDCSQGEVGLVYDGAISYHTQKVSFSDFEMPKTDLMLFVDKPLGVFGKSLVPSEGVGLARTEFVVTEILNNIHPMAWVRYPDVSKVVREEIDKRAPHYADKTQYFVDKLAEAWGRIAATFYPKPIIMRFSDFKSDEYADLIGGDEFESKDEPNPMIGIRGAVRYLHPNYMPAFRLECAAVKKAREVFGFTNIIPMIPFCRTPEEGLEVLAIMKECGLEQGKDDLKIYVMVEITSNAVLADQFADIFDGGSIGSNDFVLGVFSADVRGVPWLAGRYDENHLAVRRLLKYAIEAFHKKGKKIGICGEAPSYLMPFTKFLVECGIDSITITSGSLGQYKKTAEAIKRFEEELGIK